MSSPGSLLSGVEAPESREFRYVAMSIAFALFAALSLTCAVMSEGFLEADACTHYLYARFAFEEPHYLVNLWGRPLVTGLYALPARLGGLLGVRATSLVLALVCAWAAYRIARLQGYRYPILALIFTLAQPLVFLHSFSELTELPFAVLIAFAFWAYRLRRWWLMALLIGLAPLGRPEGFGFIGLAGVALLAHRRWRFLPLLILPLVIWNHAGWELYGRAGAWWRWLPSQWPYAQESVYASGPLLYFVALLPVFTSPFVLPATLLGTWRSLAVPGFIHVFISNHPRRCQALIALVPAMIFVGHSLLYWLGKMASNGEPRYMLVVAPFWGLLSAWGWEWVFGKFQWQGILRWAGVAALLPALANQYLYRVLPLRQSEDWQRARAVAAWYENDAGLRRDYPRLMGAHPGLYYYLDISPSNLAHSVPWLKSELANVPRGTLLIWDRIYGVYNADSARSIKAEDIVAAGWVEIHPSIPAFGEISPQELAVLDRHERGATLDRLETQPQITPPADPVWRIFVSPDPADP